jgi:hypothetical protein
LAFIDEFWLSSANGCIRWRRAARRSAWRWSTRRRWRPTIRRCAQSRRRHSRPSHNGLGFYRYSYNGSDQAYVGVIAQEVQMLMPEAVVRGWDGYLRVFYDKLGLKFQTYDRWIASVARIPTITRIRH